MSLDEQTVKPDLLGVVSDPTEREQLVHFKPPDGRKLKTIRRVADLEYWVVRQHRIVYDFEIVEYAMKHFNVQEGQAKRYLSQVVKDFERRGLTVLR